MKAILATNIIYSGLEESASGQRVEGVLAIETEISIPAIPTIDQAFHLSGDAENSSQGLSCETTVETIMWCPAPGRENIVIPWIFLKEIDCCHANERDFPNKTIGEVQEIILTKLMASTKDERLRAGNIKFRRPQP